MGLGEFLKCFSVCVFMVFPVFVLSRMKGFVVVYSIPMLFAHPSPTPLLSPHHTHHRNINPLIKFPLRLFRFLTFGCSTVYTIYFRSK